MRHKERAFDVGVKDEVKVFFADVLHTLHGAHTRVIDQDVDAADLGLRMGHGRLDAVQISDIQRHHMGVATFGLNLGPQSFELFNAPAGQHHRSARSRERFGKLHAQAAGCARDQSHAS